MNLPDPEDQQDYPKKKQEIEKIKKRTKINEL